MSDMIMPGVSPVVPVTAKQVIVSHSEVDSFLLCEQRHFYAFAGGGFEPNTFSDSLYRGIVGHSALEHYYKAIQSGSSKADAMDVGLTALQAFGLEATAKYDILADLGQRILPRYFMDVAANWDEGFRVLAVEKTYRLTVPYEGIEMVLPFTPDLIMADPQGRVEVWDHKFLYDFMNGSAVDLQPQIPKYIGALRALDMPVYGGRYNTLRWRKVKSEAVEDNFKRQPFVPSNARIRNAMVQQFKVMHKIGKYKAGPIAEWKSDVTRVLNNMICKSCSFKEPCSAEINGGDISLMMQVEYSPNSYGYKAEVENGNG